MKMRRRNKNSEKHSWTCLCPLSMPWLNRLIDKYKPNWNITLFAPRTGHRLSVCRAVTLNAWNSSVKTMRFVYFSLGLASPMKRTSDGKQITANTNVYFACEHQHIGLCLDVNDQDSESRVAQFEADLVRWNGHDTKRYIINYVIWLFWLCCHKRNARAIIL